MTYSGPVEIAASGVLIRAEALAPRSARTHDAAPPRRPAVRRGDQAPDPEGEGQGEVICRLGKNGATNQWAAEDVNGGPLVIRLGGDGRYEIVRPDNRNGGAHNNTRALEMKDPLAADQRRGFAALAPNRDAADNNPRSLGIFQKLLDRHYQPGD